MNVPRAPGLSCHVMAWENATEFDDAITPRNTVGPAVVAVLIIRQQSALPVIVCFPVCPIGVCLPNIHRGAGNSAAIVGRADIDNEP